MDTLSKVLSQLVEETVYILYVLIQAVSLKHMVMPHNNNAN